MRLVSSYYTKATITNLFNIPTYWSHEWIRKIAQKIVKVSDTWTLDCFYTDNAFQEWAFHMPKYLTFNEALTYGTQEVISHYYEQIAGRKPNRKSRIRMTVSSKEIKDSTTAIMWMYEDPLFEGANYYIDRHTQKDVWLCPYLPFLFGKAPTFLWIDIQVVK